MTQQQSRHPEYRARLQGYDRRHTAAPARQPRRLPLASAGQATQPGQPRMVRLRRVPSITLVCTTTVMYLPELNHHNLSPAACQLKDTLSLTLCPQWAASRPEVSSDDAPDSAGSTRTCRPLLLALPAVGAALDDSSRPSPTVRFKGSWA